MHGDHRKKLDNITAKGSVVWQKSDPRQMQRHRLNIDVTYCRY